MLTLSSRPIQGETRNFSPGMTPRLQASAWWK